MSKININNYQAYLLDYFEENLSESLSDELKVFVLSHPELEIDLDDSELPVISDDKIGFGFKTDLLKDENDFPNSDLLNYLEGNLSADERIIMEARLNSDTELTNELNAFKKTILSFNTSDTLDSKACLVKSEDEFVLNSTTIAYVENILSPAERIEFEKNIFADSELKSEIELLNKTKLVADKAIAYPDKDSLLKEGRVLALFSLKFVTRAAAALLLLLGIAFVIKNYTGKTTFNKIEIAKKNNNIPAHTVESNSVVTDEEMHTSAPESNLVAVKPVNKNHKLFNAASTDTLSQKVETNNIAKIETPVITNDILVDTAALANTTIISENSMSDKPTIKYTNITALALATDDEENQSAPVKQSFWKRAVKVAQQVNGLGLKAVKGDEKENENYSLSFNSFSVEKK